MDGFDAIKDLKWLGFILVAIWVLWYLSGGPARYEAKNGILLKPPAPLSTGEIYGRPPEISFKIPDTINVSLLDGRAAIGAKNNLRATNPQKEYFEIVAQSDTPINITGWKLVGKNGPEAVIGGGVRLFKSGEVNKTTDIYLSRGEKAVISSGASPVGFSFLVNSCSGYLGQFQKFEPSLSNACPSLSGESLVKKYPLESACLDYLKEVPLCETPVKTLPSGLSSACRQFVLEHASHNACVSDNIGAGGFYGNEWRVYLGKTGELWGDHDSIKIYDSSGAFVGTYTY